MDRIGRFRVLAWSESIPLDAIVATASFSDEHAALVRSALLAVPHDHVVTRAVRDTFGWPAAGFAVMPDTFYDSVERALGLTVTQ